MFGKLTAQRIDQLRALADQKVPCPKQHGARQLFLRLDGDEAHGRPACRLRNRFRIRRVVLLAFDKRLNVCGRNQANFMPGVVDSPTPVVDAPAGLHSDDAARLLGKKFEDFLTRELLSKGHASIRQSAVRLKGPLRNVETDDSSFFHGCPLGSAGCDKHRRLGTLRCRQEGASTPSLRHPSWVPTVQFSGEQRPELQDPPSHRFVGHIKPTFSEQIFDVGIAEHENARRAKRRAG
jgi:hypothetical protein